MNGLFIVLLHHNMRQDLSMNPGPLWFEYGSIRVLRCLWWHVSIVRSGDYRYPRGTTAVLETSIRRFEVVSETVQEAMES